jgi:hypothetical protein
VTTVAANGTVPAVAQYLFAAVEIRHPVSILSFPLSAVLIFPVFVAQHPPARRETNICQSTDHVLSLSSQQPIYEPAELLADCQKDCCPWFFFSAF